MSSLKIESVDRLPKGGQQVGMIPLGVKITHLPTGLTASCEVERSQMKNRNIAIAMIAYGVASLGLEDKELNELTKTI